VHFVVVTLVVVLVVTSTVGPGFIQQVAAASTRDHQLLWDQPPGLCDGNGRPIS
jgi:hypothetical protein